MLINCTTSETTARAAAMTTKTTTTNQHLLVHSGGQRQANSVSLFLAMHLVKLSILSNYPV